MSAVTCNDFILSNKEWRIYILMESKPKLLKQGIIQIAAGGSAGFVEVCIMHPLDLIKTRMQLQSVKVYVTVAREMKSTYYFGIFDCFRKMYRQEGYLSFWKGILPPILAETPKRAIKFFTFEQYKKLFMFLPNPLMFSLAGVAAGVTEAIIVNPFEVIKVSLQSNRNKFQMCPGAWSVAREVVQSGGLGFEGLNKGLSATVWRNGVFNMVYFGFYHSVNNMIPKVNDEVGEFLKRFLIGFIAGTIASCMNIPFDVAKSRIQGPEKTPGQLKYKKLFTTIRLIYIDEGWKALYKGLLPKVIRLGPGGAIMMVMNETVNDFLLRRFPD